ncbi:IS21-like element helper ATPase IstB [Enterococcus faecalis]|uniref:IS21-like element helper ATPase IstB n=1 Tax=Enterococcus faecalis TaxID=1351 RepID=UPI0020907FF2|nr:IS21-like element helper ATPase IstB [Enterococcus faecalis]MCO5542242.1 IS21-like element helper ATPase IstB [Enterococcus faecalis]
MSSYHQLLNNLETLELQHMKELFPTHLERSIHQELSLTDSLLDLTDKEIEYRKKRLIERRMKKANFPYRKGVKDFDFDLQPKLKKAEVMDCSTLRFMDTHDNLLFIGNSRVGKTHLATAIGIEASKRENSVYFILSNELIEKLDRAHKRGTLEAALKRYSRYDLLIIDEIGYLPMTKNGANLFFQLINLRYEKKSTILTSNIPLSQWTDVFQDKKLTNAIIDRLIHHSKILSINGKSYRMKDYMEIKGPKTYIFI